MPLISAENVDDNVFSANMNHNDGLDLCNEDLDMISDMGSISSQSSIYASTESTQNFDENSQELINKIDNANNGDTILIEPGTYKVHGINITKNISLYGNGDPRDVIIDGEGLSSIFLIQNKDISLEISF